MKVKTYKELEEYIKMFKKQNIDLLIIKSKAGLGKTFIIKEMMKKEDYVYICTHSTPLKTYINLYENLDFPVCFDDLNSLFTSPIMTSMLKCLAETIKEKELHYETTSKLAKGLPSSFKTKSNVCILLNQFDGNNPVLAPLVDRSFYLEFEPSKEEILNKIRKFKSSPKSEKCVLDFIEKNYLKIKKFTLRTYVKALQLYRDNPKKWKKRFMNMVGFDEKLIQYLELKEKYKTDKEQIKHFDWGKTTYYRIKKGN